MNLMRSFANAFLATIVAALVGSPFCGAQQIGDPGWVFDERKFDPRIPAMREWARAGVQGGIPYREDNAVRAMVAADPKETDMAVVINQAIEQVGKQGGGVVLLKNGVHRIASTIVMRSNVILRGENRSQTIMQSYMKYTGVNDGDRTETILMENVQRAALEDFTLTYIAQSSDGVQRFPLDTDWALTDEFEHKKRSGNYENNRIYTNRKKFEYEEKKDMNVTFVHIKGGASANNWIDNCSFINSGSDHIFIEAGEFMTIRNTNVEGAFQKGGQGNGYGINCYGQYILMTGITTKKVRHWAIQQGAKFCVIYDSDSEVDINFHQGDDGLNLVENTRIHVPHWGPWSCFQTGASYHGAPGEANLFYHNDCVEKQKGPRYTDDKIYTFGPNREIEVSKFKTPLHGVLYAVRRKGNPWISVSELSLSATAVTVAQEQTIDLDVSVAPADASNRSVVWSSSNEKVARVAYDGTITGVAPGTAVITATTVDRALTASCEVVTTGLPNGKKVLSVHQLATASAGKVNPPSGAVDANTGTRWSANHFPQWLEVDLGAVQSISSIQVVAFGGRAYQFTVSAKSDQGEPYQLLVDRSKNTTSGSAENPIIDDFEPVNARYVRLRVTGAHDYSGSWVSIAEFKVIGEEQ